MVIMMVFANFRTKMMYSRRLAGWPAAAGWLATQNVNFKNYSFMY